jgi:hypothetical protein
MCRASVPQAQSDYQKRWREALHATATGQFTKEIDKALPQKHTKALYDHLSREEAVILAQLRTNKSKLNEYLAKINASMTDLCDCGQAETRS